MPSRFIRSKFVALDSSHLGNLVRDTFSSNPARREKAAAFERAFENSGSVLLLSWHHLPSRSAASVTPRQPGC